MSSDSAGPDECGPDDEDDKLPFRATRSNIRRGTPAFALKAVPPGAMSEAVEPDEGSQDEADDKLPVRATRSNIRRGTPGFALKAVLPTTLLPGMAEPDECSADEAEDVVPLCATRSIIPGGNPGCAPKALPPSATQVPRSPLAVSLEIVDPDEYSPDELGNILPDCEQMLASHASGRGRAAEALADKEPGGGRGARHGGLDDAPPEGTSGATKCRKLIQKGRTVKFSDGSAPGMGTVECLDLARAVAIESDTTAASGSGDSLTSARSENSELSDAITTPQGGSNKYEVYTSIDYLFSFVPAASISDGATDGWYHRLFAEPAPISSTEQQEPAPPTGIEVCAAERDRGEPAREHSSAPALASGDGQCRLEASKAVEVNSGEHNQGGLARQHSAPTLTSGDRQRRLAASKAIEVCSGEHRGKLAVVLLVDSYRQECMVRFRCSREVVVVAWDQVKVVGSPKGSQSGTLQGYGEKHCRQRPQPSESSAMYSKAAVREAFLGSLSPE